MINTQQRYQDSAFSGLKEVDRYHSALRDCIASLHRAITANDNHRAFCLVGELQELASLHYKTGRDRSCPGHHPFPHEIIDDIVLRIRSAIQNHVSKTVSINLLSNLTRMAVDEVAADRRLVAQLVAYSRHR